MSKMLNLTLEIWRQAEPGGAGAMKTYPAEGISEDMSFLEMLDVVNDRLAGAGEEPIAFEHDCREGICGSCGMMINGRAHGPRAGTAACQLHMRQFADGDTITIEPWRAAAFPVVKDLVVNRSALDRIVEAGGYISVNTGAAPEANLTPVPKEVADAAFDAAACIGSAESQLTATELDGLPPTRSNLYTEKVVRDAYPGFEDVIKDSIEAATPRPLTPAYTDLSLAIQRSLHPPAEIDPEDPSEAYDSLLEAVEDAVKREGLL